MEAVTHNSQKIAFINYLRTFNLSEDEINQIADRAYNSISPDTVREMYEALKEKTNKYTGWLDAMKENRANEYSTAPDGEVIMLDQIITHTAEIIRDLKTILTKAEQELKK